MQKLRRFDGAILAAILFAAAPAHAERPNVHLRVDRAAGTESCLDEKRLAGSVEERLGRRVFDASRPPELRVVVEFSEARRYAANIELSDALGVLGHRELSTEARHCSALDDSVALIVALLVDTPPTRPDATESPVGPAAPAAPAAPARVQPPATPIRVPARTLAPREPFTFDARIGGSLGVGQLPGAALGGELGFGIRPPRGPWVRLIGEVYAPTERRLEGEGAGVRLGLQRLGLELCGRFADFGALETELCAGQRFGRIPVSGFGFQQNREVTQISFAVSLGGNGYLRLGGSFAAYAGLHGEVPVVRQEFTARPDGQDDAVVFEQSPAALLLKAGLRVEL